MRLFSQSTACALIAFANVTTAATYVPRQSLQLVSSNPPTVSRQSLQMVSSKVSSNPPVNYAPCHPRSGGCRTCATCNQQGGFPQGGFNQGPHFGLPVPFGPPNMNSGFANAHATANSNAYGNGHASSSSYAQASAAGGGSSWATASSSAQSFASGKK